MSHACTNNQGRIVSTEQRLKRENAFRVLVLPAMLVVGLSAMSGAADATALGDLAAQMQPGQWRELITQNFDGMVLPNFAGDGSSPIIEFTDEAQRNPSTKKIFILGCARGAPGGGGTAYACGSTSAEDAGYVSYDETTNTWQRMPDAPVRAAPHAYDHAALNPLNGDFYFYETNQLSNHKMWKYSAAQWQSLPVPTIYSGFAALEFFPELNALVLVDGGDGAQAKLMTLPNGAGSWSSVNINFPIGTFSNFTEYSAPHHLMYFGGGTNGDRVLLKFDAQSRITRAADAPLSLGQFGGGGRTTVDPVSGNLLAFETGSGPGTGSVYEYNPTTNQWSKHGTHPLGTPYGQVIAVFTPVVEHGAIFVVTYNSANNSKVYLYRHSPGAGAVIAAPLPPTALSAQ